MKELVYITGNFVQVSENSVYLNWMFDLIQKDHEKARNITKLTKRNLKELFGNPVDTNIWIVDFKDHWFKIRIIKKEVLLYIEIHPDSTDKDKFGLVIIDFIKNTLL